MVESTGLSQFQCKSVRIKTAYLTALLWM